MNDLSRAGHDDEIERLQEKLKDIDPTSKEYTDVMKNYDILVKLANEDDKAQADNALERIRIDAETDKQNAEMQKHKWTVIAGIGTAVVTSVTSIGIYLMICMFNKAQVEEVLDFEQNGFARTSRSLNDQVKLPMHRI